MRRVGGHPAVKAEEIKALVAGSRDLTEEVVEVPEWAVTMRVVLPSGARKVAFDRALANQDIDNVERVSRMMAAVLLDEDDVAPFFSDDGWRVLYDRNPDVLLRVMTVVNRVCSVTSEKIEIAAGESEGGPSIDSVSVSA
jgi:hypothetical protein